MRWSQAFIPTLREAPSDADSISHKLLTKAGFIRKLSSGIYIYLPLAIKVLKKIEKIIREEMERINAIELSLPILSPKELWEQTNRWNIYGKELMKIKDRYNRYFALGPTHEEIITYLISKEVKSYRDLPLNLYQIHTKFRDEIRPRSGIIRAREFIMKDGYSFDENEELAEKTYNKVFESYCRIFNRCKLNFVVAEAETGAIGGSFSHEFMVLADSGEDVMIVCPSCGYCANREKAIGKTPQEYFTKYMDKPIEKVITPNTKTVEELSEFLNCSKFSILKTLLYKGDNKFVVLLIRGNHDVNVSKVKNATGIEELTMLTKEEVERIVGCPPGFVGPIGLTEKINNPIIITDDEVIIGGDLIVGANEIDRHFINAVPNRDFNVGKIVDIKLIKEGDKCTKCNSNLIEKRGIEIAHTFKLGKKYSIALNAKYVDKYGKEQFIVMGCYGIGISRILAAAVEQSHDENGIIWQMPIAPYQVLILPINILDKEIKEVAEKIYIELLENNIEVLIDDRKETAGVKFKDADLIGIPIRITIGRKLSEKKVEIRKRNEKKEELVNLNDVVKRVKEIILTS
jgi:prolyl-tRNA synthetase